MEDRKKKTILAYALITGKSAKEVSDYFKNEHENKLYAVSEMKVIEYLNEHFSKPQEEQIEFLKLLDKTQEEITEEVVMRINLIMPLAMQNKTISEISEELDIDYFTVYKDILMNVRKINPTLAFVLQTKTGLNKSEEVYPFDRFPFKKRVRK